MRTKSLPFQLEETTWGATLLQGLAAGMPLGFCYLLLMILLYPSPEDIVVVLYLPYFLALGGVFGLVKAIPLWAIYRLTGFRMKAPLRILVSTISLTLIVSFLIYEPGDHLLLVIVAGTSFLTSLPIALLVGSQVQPWELLTYWRVTFREHGIKESLRSSGILAMGGVLPLRLLSIAALGYWIAGSAAIWSLGQTNLTQGIMFMLVPIMYFAVSAYLTFRSPGSYVLLAIGLVINLPLSYMPLCGATFFPEADWRGNTLSALAIADGIFISAWIAFIAARFIVTINDFLPAGALVKELNHHCLGSRFLEWRERAA